MCFPPAWGMLMSPAGRAATPPPLLCRHPAAFCGYKGQFRQYTGSAFLHTQAPGKLLHIIASLHPQARRMFLHVIANQCAHWCGNPFSCGSTNRKAAPVANPQLPAHSPRYHPLAPAHTCPPSACHCEERGSRPATWQSVLLRQHRTKSNSSRQIRRSCEFALSTTDLPGISAGMRIATPVCALARNDMQKTGSCQRLQGRFPAVPWQRPLANADTWQISACHCEERSDVAIRSPAAAQTEKQSFGRIRKALRICPNGSKLSRYFCGETDCRTSVRTGSQ